MGESYFVASYSGGKDSALATYRAMQSGLAPMALFTTYQAEKDRSWFHNIPRPALEDISAACGIALDMVAVEPESYARRMKQVLAGYARRGARYCVFGDVDIEEHREWCTQRCKSAGIEAVFPLWGEGREAVVRDFVAQGFRAVITTVNTQKLPVTFLGRVITDELLDEIKALGVDVCGEYGEYHSFVTDGPIFTRPLDVRLGAVISAGDYARVEIVYCT